MKTFLAVAVLLTVLSLAQAGLDRAQSIATLKKCQKETGAKENVEDVFDKQIIPTSKEGKCMMACVLTEKGLMKDNKVDATAVSNFFEKVYADDPEQLEKAAGAVGKCSLIDVKGLDKCDVAVAYMKCGQENDFRL
uniref:Odorant-binding protein 42 n=1 Tax=Matsumurasca onukii TaxID=2912585 RepID=A0A343WGX3_MATON|nr:odorant-binding protein 42 [Matsumurasca onukii]